MVWGRYLVLGYLDPYGDRFAAIAYVGIVQRGVCLMSGSVLLRSGGLQVGLQKACRRLMRTL